MKNSALYDVTPCGSCKNRRSFHPDDGGDIFSKRLSLLEPHAVTSQKTTFFKYLMSVSRNVRLLKSKTKNLSLLCGSVLQRRLAYILWRKFSALFGAFEIRINGRLRVAVSHGRAGNRSQKGVKEKDNVEEYGGLYETV
jgi:hypothetical protein